MATAPDTAQATATHTQGNFTITTRKLPISKAGPIDALSHRLGGLPVPEMIFGDNLVELRYQRAPRGAAGDAPSWAIAFAAEPALDAVDKTGANMLQVAHARDWSSSRARTSAGIREVVRPFDWSYSTAYRGSVASTTDAATQLQPSTRAIPLALLQRRDPILFFDEVVLYESELDDNGVSVYSVKVRVHARRMLLLARLFMRLDHVLVRVRDTRVYVDFEHESVLREYTAREAPFELVRDALRRSGCSPDDVLVAMRDANVLAPLLPVVETVVEEVELAAAAAAA